MVNPVLVETVRGNVVDTRHRGAVAVCDADGAVIWSAGDIEAPVFPRSAAKLFQAVPLVECGAADSYGLTDEELALACSSHSAEDGHVAATQSVLDKIGLSESDLECGSHWPLHNHRQLVEFIRRGSSPSQLHNNCSGKHAGFLCACCHQGIATGGYIETGHALQRQIKAVLEDLTGEQMGEDRCAVDGCSIPSYAVSLHALAQGFAKAATGAGLGPSRAAAVRRLMDACIANPWFTAGTGRFCVELMRAGQGAIYAKTGADGAYVAALPQAGLGIAVKCIDGATRPAEIMMASVLMRLFADDAEMRARLEPLSRRKLKNWNGIVVGEMRPAER
ncbi:asparaginase [Oricola sp.]|uniref:asparaginase n=1 Tax=Oricola sp. TaxID=1979950 RepID=UPI003BACE9DD